MNFGGETRDNRGGGGGARDKEPGKETAAETRHSSLDWPSGLAAFSFVFRTCAVDAVPKSLPAAGDRVAGSAGVRSSDHAASRHAAFAGVSACATLEEEALRMLRAASQGAWAILFEEAN